VYAPTLVTTTSYNFLLSLKKRIHLEREGLKDSNKHTNGQTQLKPGSRLSIG